MKTLILTLTVVVALTLGLALFSVHAQVAVPIPPLTAPIPAVVDPGQPVNCALNGKRVSCQPLPQRTLLPASQTTTAPSVITLPSQYLFSCPVTLVNGVPDLTQPLQCTITAAK